MRRWQPEVSISIQLPARGTRRDYFSDWSNERGKAASTGSDRCKFMKTVLAETILAGSAATPGSIFFLSAFSRERNGG